MTRIEPPVVVRRLRHDPNEQPFIVIREVTRACQLACMHCRAGAIRRRDPLERPDLVDPVAYGTELGLSAALSPSVTPRVIRSALAELAAAGAKALVIRSRASLWSVFFLVPTGRGTALRPLSVTETEDVLNWLYDVTRLAAVAGVT